MHEHGGRRTPARPPRRWRWPHLAGLAGAVLALTLAVAVAACGGGGKANGVASLNGATQTTSAGNANSGKGQAALNWARCMRQHGINLPDPQITRDGIDQQLPSRAQTKSPEFKAADQACRKQLPNGGQPTPPSAQERQQALAFARCMRQHGANLPDPQITADGINQPWPDPPERDTPKFRAAQQACERAVPPARR